MASVAEKIPEVADEVQQAEFEASMVGELLHMYKFMRYELRGPVGGLIGAEQHESARSEPSCAR